ncbi:MAG: 50S ribosomal protein L4 [Deltaproteobacteria bacterium]|nr:50S ribosomal protein L4 [Deltaproteobacteria bacterium]
MSNPVYNLQKKKVGELELLSAVFDKPLKSVLHQVILGYQTNQRQGTSSVLTRHFVTGSTRKIYRQKGTGQARHGDIKAPIFVGGGNAFGPHPRDWSSPIPVKLRHEALREALSLKKKQEQLMIVDKFELSKVKTKEAFKTLKGLGLDNALVVLDEVTPEAVKSVRNLAHFKVCRSTDLNALEVMRYDNLLMTVGAVGKVQKWLS